MPSTLATFAAQAPRSLPIVLGGAIIVLAAGCSPAASGPPPSDATMSTSGDIRFVPEVGKLANEDGEKAHRRAIPSRSKLKPHFRDRGASGVSYADSSN